MHYHRMNILVRLILYRMKKQRNFENAEMLSHISVGGGGGRGREKKNCSGKNFSDGPVSRFAPPKMKVWLRHWQTSIFFLSRLLDQYEYMFNTLMLFLTCTCSQFSAICFSPYGYFNYIVLHLKWLYNNM